MFYHYCFEFRKLFDRQDCQRKKSNSKVDSVAKKDKGKKQQGMMKEQVDYNLS